MPVDGRTLQRNDGLVVTSFQRNLDRSGNEPLGLDGERNDILFKTGPRGLAGVASRVNVLDVVDQDDLGLRDRAAILARDERGEIM